MKKCLISLTEKEIKIKMIVRLFFHLKDWQLIKIFNKTLLEKNKKITIFIPIARIITKDQQLQVRAEIAQPSRKAIWHLLSKLQMHIPFDPTIPLLELYAPVILLCV